MKNAWERVKDCFTINQKLLPIKLIIFLFYSSAFSLTPYLTIHMTDIGITVDQIAIIYAILPFTIFLTPAGVGFLADKLGNFTRVLMLTVIGSAIFHTALLFIPTVTRTHFDSVQNSRATLSDGSQIVLWSDFGWCQLDSGSGGEHQPVTFNSQVTLYDCHLDCPVMLENVCSHLSARPCSSVELDGSTLVSLENIDFQFRHGNTSFVLGYITQQGKPVGLTSPDCELNCNSISFDNSTSQSKIFGSCDTIEGDPMFTVALYFVFRALATMCLACNFTMIDAQTIQICKQEEEAGRSGALGKQFVFQALAQAVISPLLGKVMDWAAADGPPNYVVPFIAQNIFTLLAIFLLCFAKIDIRLPKTAGMEGVRSLFRNLDIWVFLVVFFVLGNLYGFIETFLFIYLKETMHAPMYLLGLTITTGAVVSIPFLYISDWLVGKIGVVNVLIMALFMYGVRYTGYSFITSAWYAFPFEALELFTIQLMKVAAAQFIGINAPKGLLATFNGIAGGLHYGIGRGCGGLIGGYLISVTGDISQVFRIFGIASGVAGLFYFSYEWCVRRTCLSESGSFDLEAEDSSSEDSSNNKDDKKVEAAKDVTRA